VNFYGREAGGNCPYRTSGGVRNPSHPMEVAVKTIIRFLKSEEGPTTVEYAVMLAFIIAVCTTAIASMGGEVNAVFASVNTRG
jgi:pilus assembly protein Flp/PilA